MAHHLREIGMAPIAKAKTPLADGIVESIQEHIGFPQKRALASLDEEVSDSSALGSREKRARIGIRTTVPGKDPRHPGARTSADPYTLPFNEGSAATDPDIRTTSLGPAPTEQSKSEFDSAQPITTEQNAYVEPCANPSSRASNSPVFDLLSMLAPLEYPRSHPSEAGTVELLDLLQEEGLRYAPPSGGFDAEHTSPEAMDLPDIVLHQPHYQFATNPNLDGYCS